MKTVKVKNTYQRKVAVNLFEKTLESVTEDTSRHYARLFRDYIRQVLELQLYRWEALNANYLKYKKAHGLDERILIATGEYKDNIKVFKHGKGYVVGLPRGKKHNVSGIPLVTLAKYHEFGTSKMPARPMWRTAISVFVRKHKGKVK